MIFVELGVVPMMIDALVMKEKFVVPGTVVGDGVVVTTWKAADVVTCTVDVLAILSSRRVVVVVVVVGGTVVVSIVVVVGAGVVDEVMCSVQLSLRTQHSHSKFAFTSMSSKLSSWQ